MAQDFFLAVGLQHREGGLITGKHVFDSALAGNVLDIATGEGELVGQRRGVFLGKGRNHGLPDFRTGVLLWEFELHLEDEAALESGVQIGQQVGGGNEDTFDVLHLFQDDVLDGVVHLVHTLLHVLDSLGEDGVCFVEKKDGSLLAALAERAVHLEDTTDRFFTVTDPLTLELGHVHAEDVTPAPTGQFIHTGRLAGAGSAVEDGVEAFAHTGGQQALLDLLEVLVVKEILQTGHLSILRFIEEEFLGLDGFGRDDIPVTDSLFRGQFHLAEEVVFHLIRDGQGIRVHESVLDGKADQTAALERRILIGKVAFDTLVILHKLGEVSEGVDFYGLVPEGYITVTEIEEHTAFRIGTVRVQRGTKDLLAEVEMVVVAHHIVQFFQETVLVDSIVAVSPEELTEAGEQLLRGESAHLHGLEFGIVLHCLERFWSHSVAEMVPVTAANLDDAGLIHFTKVFMVTNELNVGATEEVSEILVIHQIIGSGFLQDTCQQNGAVVPYIIMASDIINVAFQLLDSLGRKAMAVDLSEDTVQAGRLGLDGLIFGNEALFFKQGGLSSSHIRVRFSIHTGRCAISYASSFSFSRRARLALQQRMVAALGEHPRISAISCGPFPSERRVIICW